MTMARVILAEDDNFLASIMAQRLAKKFDVVHVQDGQELLDEVAKKRPDGILLDLLMPKVDGFQVLEALKKKPETASIPVLVLSNLGQKEDVDRAMAAGATEMLIKVHFTPDEVSDHISKIIEHK